MTNATKRKAIIFLILTALITVLLAVALPQLQLQRGIPLPGMNSRAEVAPQEDVEPPLSVNINTFLASILGLFMLMTLIYLMVSRQRLNWRDITQALLAFALFSLVLGFFLYQLTNIKISAIPTAVEVLPVEVAAPLVGPPLAPVPSSLLWLVGACLVGLILLLIFMALRARIRHAVERDPLALEAEQAVEAIKAGQDLSNVIIRCYQQMSVVLKKEQGLTLEETMTARDFEALLEKRGVPNAPVRQLTRLFEIARYAAQAPGPAAEAQAIDCFNTIAQYSLKKGPGQRK